MRLKKQSEYTPVNNIHNHVTEVVFNEIIFVDEAIKQERFECYQRYKGALKPGEEPDFKSFAKFEKREERKKAKNNE